MNSSALSKMSSDDNVDYGNGYEQSNWPSGSADGEISIEDIDGLLVSQRCVIILLFPF